LFAGEELSPKRFSEEFRSSPPLSSPHILCGLFLGAATQRTDPDRLFVVLPRAHPSKLCLSFVSLDKRYEAEAEYELALTAEGLHRLRLPTKYGPLLSGYHATELAVRAELVDECGQGKPVLLPALWSENAERASVTGLVRSGATSTELTLVAEADRAVARCSSIQPTSSQSVVAFNHICSVSAPGARGEVKLYVRRTQFDYELSRRVEVLYLPEETSDRSTTE